MKRFLILAAALVLGLALVAGCNDTDEHGHGMSEAVDTTEHMNDAGAHADTHMADMPESHPQTAEKAAAESHADTQEHAHTSSEMSATDPASVYTCPMHPEVLSRGQGRCPKCGMNLVKLDDVQSSDAAYTAAQVYTCSMHPEVLSRAPGRCPKCGMNLVKVDQPRGTTR